MINTRLAFLFWVLFQTVSTFWFENCLLDDSYKQLIQTSLEPFRNGITPELI